VCGNNYTKRIKHNWLLLVLAQHNHHHHHHNHHHPIVIRRGSHENDRKCGVEEILCNKLEVVKVE
jgi:hypothetical protein